MGDPVRVLESSIIEEHGYIYTGERLMREFVTTRKNGTTIIDGYQLDFTYDASGNPISATYNSYYGASGTYYYVANIQGDVMAILNTSGEVVVEYVYDAWGNVREIPGPLADTIGERNPLRYRGYVYDQETEYYYLQSRYYAPEMGRFINADAYASTSQGVLGHNMFVYCLNNPANYMDYAGKRAGHAKAIAKAKQEAADEKYNSETIHVFVENEGAPVEGKLNVMIRPAYDVIQIINSYEITDPYEMNAILNTVMEHPLYDPEVYVTDKAQAVVEWQAHNVIHEITSFIPKTESLLDKLGFEDANRRTESVDLDTVLTAKNKILYTVAAWVDMLF